jgi:hypothetical protein
MFFSPLEDFFKKMLEYNYISKKDMALYLITDDIDEAITYIKEHSIANGN